MSLTRATIPVFVPFVNRPDLLKKWQAESPADLKRLPERIHPKERQGVPMRAMKGTNSRGRLPSMA